MSPVNVHLSQHFTKPPSRYSESALVSNNLYVGFLSVHSGHFHAWYRNIFPFYQIYLRMYHFFLGICRLKS